MLKFVQRKLKKDIVQKKRNCGIHTSCEYLIHSHLKQALDFKICYLSLTFFNLIVYQLIILMIIL